MDQDLPIPDSKDIEKISLMLPLMNSILMIPVRFPDFIDNINNRTYPDYFIYAVLSASVKYLENKDKAQKKVLQTKYAKKALEIIKALKNSASPFVLWALVFVITYTNDVYDPKATEQASVLANVFARRTRIYQLDLKRNILNHSEEDMEFSRRVWWTYYSYISSNTIFTCKYPAIDSRDIVVNLPTNDFSWRYGNVALQVRDTPIKLRSTRTQPGTHLTDNSYLLILSFALFVKIVSFLNKRWRKGVFGEDVANSYFSKYLKLIKQHGNKIQQKYPKLNLSLKGLFESYDGDIELNIYSESALNSHWIHQLHQNMLIYMYQSDLVRDSNIKINPERIKEAKLSCLSAAENLEESLVWTHNNITSKYYTFAMVSNTFIGTIILNNTLPLKNDQNVGHYYTKLQNIIEIYKEIGKKSEIMNSLTLFIDHIAKIGDMAHKKNINYRDLIERMKPTLYQRMIYTLGYCCFKENLSTLDIADYLSLPFTKPSLSTFKGKIKTLKDKEIFPNNNENPQEASSSNRTFFDNQNINIEPNKSNFGSLKYIFGPNTKFGVPNMISSGLGRSKASLSIIINKYDINPYYYIRKAKEIKGPCWARFTCIPYVTARINGEVTRYSMKLHEKYGPVSNEYSVTVVESPHMFSTVDEEYNRMRRRQIGPAFTQTGLNSVEDLILNSGTISLTKKIEELIEDGGGQATFNYFKTFQPLTADVIGELAFGKSFNAVPNDGHPMTEWANSAIQIATLIQAYPALKFFRFFFFKLKTHRQNISQYAVTAVKEREKMIQEGTYENKRIDILQMYLTSKNNNGNKLSYAELGQEMALMLVAGIDTTSVTMSWLLHIYMVYPDVYRKVVEEIDSVFPDRSKVIKSQGARAKLPYFMATVYECMRLKAAVSGVLFRENSDDGIVLSGYCIPPKVDMGMFTEGAHNDTDIWENPDSFIPERFLGKEGDRLKKEVILFSFGVRICPGRNLAWTEITTVIPNLMRNYNIRLPGDSRYGVNVLDKNRRNEPLLLEDLVFITCAPANAERDCNLVITHRS
ncbi:hypothetical protein BB558_003073 [Smittium angustum]|uniref:Transcription factor domain-containing protein n=1 Tax=Smittium angustum TaxID=133377 RepID=A0A2U1J6Z4_SMIAN|nr:hypothetical protein BB558_003073 [Smittium angustum]